MRFLIAIFVLFLAVEAFGQWAENRHREELTDAEITDLHHYEAGVRDAQEKLDAAQDRVKKAHGEDDHHGVYLYGNYVVIEDKE